MRRGVRHLMCVAGAVVAVAAAEPNEYWSAKARAAAIRRAHVWMPTDVASRNIRRGPREAGAFAPLARVTCDYRDDKLGGRTPKFACAVAPNDVVKVKYGADNGEVYAEVAATRLLWALGFAADREYPVRVVCRNCPPDPHRDDRARQPRVVFDAAAIERKFRGEPIEVVKDSGWAWPELDLVEEAAGGAPVAHRDALKLLAVFMQHTDSKPEQQRLVCLDSRKTVVATSGTNDTVETCARPMMMLNDVGLTFGRASLLNRNTPSAVNFEDWSQEPVWKDKERCIGNLPVSQTGTLEDPIITEAGRKFLANLMMKLSDAQLRDLFEVARFAERGTDKVRAASVAEWVGAFKKKRAEIVGRTCGA